MFAVEGMGLESNDSEITRKVVSRIITEVVKSEGKLKQSNEQPLFRYSRLCIDPLPNLYSRPTLSKVFVFVTDDEEGMRLRRAVPLSLSLSLSLSLPTTKCPLCMRASP